jgi:Dyp-type peroxidase family
MALPSPNLHNPDPIDFRVPAYAPLFRKLQGNIVKGHGREHAVSIFLDFRIERAPLRKELRRLARKYVTSAYDQLVERARYAEQRVPGGLFGNLFLTAQAYRKLGLGKRLSEWFDDPLVSHDPATQESAEAGREPTFVNGMRAAATALNDVVDEQHREALEEAYASDRIDALLLLADDSEDFLLRRARAVIKDLEARRVADVVAVEIGEALRNDDEEGIEHFGYVDGRSQPLFLNSDFRDLIKGKIVPARPDGEPVDVTADGRKILGTTEKVNDKAVERISGGLELWNPFAQLSLVLRRDPAVADPEAFGSYYVFRKLEQNVRGFHTAEQQLADALKLEGSDRQRAGAMIVGRFRDGTPLAVNPTDGFIPAKANNFRYDGLNARHETADGAPADHYGLKCPFQAHVRKVNPRQNVTAPNAEPDRVGADEDVRRRIVRRGITYGERKRPPYASQPLDELPTHGVGLLFACFQSSIRNQFAFMQERWANGINFKVNGDNNNQTGLDCLIGQRSTGNINKQHWRAEYGGPIRPPNDGLVDQLELSRSHEVAFDIHGFVRFRGGEFFFAPSLTFLIG